MFQENNMPLQIIRQDITKIPCDAIVNTTNRRMIPGGGVDVAIHKAAGPDLLTSCQLHGGISVGEAKVSPGFNLPCKIVIHTLGPKWKGGNDNEKDTLALCYKNVLNKALEEKAESIAIPLISSGTYRFPKKLVLRIAVDTITEFLMDHEINVYLVVYDKKSYTFSKKLFNNVQEYIFDNYEGEERFYSMFDMEDCCQDFDEDTNIPEVLYNASKKEVIRRCREIPSMSLKPPKDWNLTELMKQMDDNFAVTLLKMIDIKGMTDIECYKKANVSKQTWYKIMNDANYRPSKTTVIAFAIALKLTLTETKHLLETVGFALSKSSKFDIIIEYFITKGEYDIFTINETLFEFDQVCLGV